MRDAKNSQHQLIFQPKNTREWFMSYLFNDDEFIAEKNAILADIKSLIGERGLGVVFLLAGSTSIVEQLRERSMHKTANITRIFNPDHPELQFNPKSKAAKIIRRIENLARKFDVKVETVEVGLRYSTHFRRLSPRSVPAVSIEGDQVVLRFDAFTRLADIKEAYKLVQAYQRQLPGYTQRNRSKDRPDLIYAVYKQRLKGRTYKEI